MDEGERELEEVYKWLDGIKLSRAKRNIARDFSDGVLMAEIIKQFYPRLVDIHNYSPANSYTSKMNNWITLNKKVLCKLDLTLDHETICALSSSTPEIIENILKKVKTTIETRSERKMHGHNDHLSFFTDTNDTPSFTENKTDPELWRKQAVQLSQEISKLKNQFEEKEEVIEILQKKVSHLETMLELKELRLQDVTKQLSRFQDQQTLPSN